MTIKTCLSPVSQTQGFLKHMAYLLWLPALLLWLNACRPAVVAPPTIMMQATATTPQTSTAPTLTQPAPTASPTASAASSRARLAFFDLQDGGTLQLQWVSADGQQVRRLYPLSSEAADPPENIANLKPAWSLDGSALFFLAGGRLLRIANLDENQVQYAPPQGLPDGQYQAFSLSPDGKYLAAAYLPDPDAPGEILGVLELETAAWTPVPIFTQPGEHGTFRFSPFAWSLDSQQFTFLANWQTPETSQTAPGGIQPIVYHPGGGGSDEAAFRDVFVSDVHGNFGNLTRIPSAAVADLFEDYPVWAPGGQRIYYLIPDMGIYGVNYDGRERARLANYTSSEQNFLVPSPDGASLLYVSAETGRSMLYRMDINGANPSALAESVPPLPNRLIPAWSPDSKRILFTCLGEGHVELCLVDSDGSNLWRLTLADFNSQAAWSPDGRWIAFVASLDKNPAVTDRIEYIPGLYVVRTDGSGRLRLAIVKDMSYVFPIWLP